MKQSLRRIAVAVLSVAVFALGMVTLHQAVSLCGNGQPACLVAAASFGLPQANEIPVVVDMSQSVSTPAETQEPSVSEFIVMLVQVTSVYLILISVIVLVVLEAIELRYLRRLIAAR
jgi:hypothetical protein